MVFGRVQRREVKPVRLDLGAFGHVKAHGAKNALNALQRQRDGVQTTGTAATTGQAHIQHFGLQMGLQFGISQSLAYDSAKRSAPYRSEPEGAGCNQTNRGVG